MSRLVNVFGVKFWHRINIKTQTHFWHKESKSVDVYRGKDDGFSSWKQSIILHTLHTSIIFRSEHISVHRMTDDEAAAPAAKFVQPNLPQHPPSSGLINYGGRPHRFHLFTTVYM